MFTRDELAAFREVSRVPESEEDYVRLVFDLARKRTHGFESYGRQVWWLFAAGRAMIEDLLGRLFHIALADGRLRAAEDAYLRHVARHFGFDAGDYARVRAHHVGPDQAGAEDPRAILGVEPGASPDVDRLAYHRLVSESHPDLVIAKGLLPSGVGLATAGVARINAAHDRLAKTRASAAFAG